MKKLFSVRTIILAGSLLLQLNTVCFHSRGAAGDVDLSFDPGSGVNGLVNSVVVQSDGKVLLGGLLTFINGTNRYGSVRLNAGGSSDNTFVPDSFNPAIGYLGFPYDYGVITALAVQPDGKVLVAVNYAELIDCDPDRGCIYNYSYTITRHNADGSRDPSFEPVVQNIPNGYQEVVTTLALQPDGKVVVGGTFGYFKGAYSLGPARLNANGSLDGSFHTSIYFAPGSVVVQSDGKIIAGDLEYAAIVRLNANGTVDGSFNPGTGAEGGHVSSVALQTDGKLLIGGEFTTFNGTNRNNIARLNADGNLDTSFNPGTGADGVVRSIALQPDGKVLICGDFATVNGVARPHVARLYGDSAAPSLTIARSNAFVIVSWPSPSTGFVLRQDTDLKATNWNTPSETVTDNGTTRFISVNPTPGNRFFRLFKP